MKHHWVLILVAVAAFFTAGLALGWFGAAAAGTEAAAGGAAAIGAEAGVAGAEGVGVAGAAAGAGAAEGLGAGVAADFAGGAAVDAGLGAGVAADFGGAAIAGGAADAGAAGLAAAGGAVADGAAQSVGVLADAGSAATTSVGGASGVGTAAADASSYSYEGLPAGAGPDASMAGSAPSSMWSGALNTAGKILKFPGVVQGIGGLMNGFQQGQMMNQQLAWQEAHAPGQVAGGVHDAFGGFSGGNKNMHQAPLPTHNPTPIAAPNAGGPMTGMNQPNGQMPTVAQQNADPYASYAQQGLMGSPFMDGPSQDEQAQS